MTRLKQALLDTVRLVPGTIALIAWMEREG
jgi:hypothetical protein